MIENPVMGVGLLLAVVFVAGCMSRPPDFRLGPRQEAPVPCPGCGGGDTEPDTGSADTGDGCVEACEEACTGPCTEHCAMGCAEHCTARCADSCDPACRADCMEGCTGGCADGCAQTCHERCTKECGG